MKIKMIFPVLTALLVSGCANVYNEDDLILASPEMADTVQIDQELTDCIRVIQTSNWKTESGVNSVAVRFRVKRDSVWSWTFCSYKDVPLTYQFTWFDAKGKAITGGHPENYAWHKVSPYPGEEFSCVSHAPGKDAVKVKLVVKRGTEVQAKEQTAPAEKPAAKAEPAKEPVATLAAPMEKPAAETTDTTKNAVSKMESLKKELPADVMQGKTTTTKAIKQKTDIADQKAKELKKQADAEVLRKTGNKEGSVLPVTENPTVTKECLCGCAKGEKCYCPENSACKKNVKK